MDLVRRVRDYASLRKCFNSSQKGHCFFYIWKQKNISTPFWPQVIRPAKHGGGINKKHGVNTPCKQTWINIPPKIRFPVKETYEYIWQIIIYKYMNTINKTLTCFYPSPPKKKTQTTHTFKPWKFLVHQVSCHTWSRLECLRGRMHCILHGQDILVTFSPTSQLMGKTKVPWNGANMGVAKMNCVCNLFRTHVTYVCICNGNLTHNNLIHDSFAVFEFRKLNDQVNFNCLIPSQYDFVETGLNGAVRFWKAMYIDKTDLNT